MIFSPQFDALIVDRVAYFDRVTVWLITPLTKEQRDELWLLFREQIEIWDKPMRWRPEFKQRLFIYQPIGEMLLTLRDRFIPPDSLVNYVEIACDLITNRREHAIQIQAEFDSVSEKTYQKTTKRQYIGRTDEDLAANWVTCYTNQKHASTNIVTYADLDSKVIASPCFHCELRISGATAVRAAGINSFSDLLTLDLVAALSKRVRLYKAPTDIAERIGRDLFRLDLNRRWGRGHYRAGLNKKMSPARRIGSIVLRSHCTDDDGRYDVFELKKLGKCIGIDFMRHFDKVSSEELFRPKQLR